MPRPSEGYHGRSPPRQDSYRGSQPASQTGHGAYGAQRPFAPPTSPRRPDQRDVRPLNPPARPYRPEYSHPGPAPIGPRAADYPYAPRQPRLDHETESRHHKYNHDTGQPPAKRFRSAFDQLPVERSAAAPVYKQRRDEPIDVDALPAQTSERSNYPHPHVAYTPQRISFSGSERTVNSTSGRLPPTGPKQPPAYPHMRSRGYEGQYRTPQSPEMGHAGPSAHWHTSTRSPVSPHLPPSPRTYTPSHSRGPSYSSAYGGERMYAPPFGGSPRMDENFPSPTRPDRSEDYAPREQRGPIMNEARLRRLSQQNAVDYDGKFDRGPHPHHPVKNHDPGNAPPSEELGKPAIEATTAQHLPRLTPVPSQYQSPSPIEQPAQEEAARQPLSDQLSQKLEGLQDATPQLPRQPAIKLHFGEVLRGVGDSQKVDDTVSQLLKKQEHTTRLAIKGPHSLGNKKVGLYANDVVLLPDMQAYLAKGFEAMARNNAQHILRLQEEYRALDDRWKEHCDMLDRLQATEAATLAASQIQYPVALQTPTLPPLSARSSSRRGTGFFGDAVRSEAEFQELLATLEAEEMTDPTLRATKTAAIVPDLMLPTDPERRLAVLDLDSTLVVDPVTFFQVEPGREIEEWTQEEQSVFCRRFALFPKAFGKIAAGLPGRSTSACVRFYYHNKYRINFRSLLDKRALRRNRGFGKGASSLLSNLQVSKPEDADEDVSVPVDEESATPDLRYAASIPLKLRHGTHIASETRPASARQPSSRKAARFTMPLASVLPDQEAIGPPAQSLLNSWRAEEAGLVQNGLLPPVTLNGSSEYHDDSIRSHLAKAGEHLKVGILPEIEA